ncbi:MAG: DUF3379 family protein [Aestuariibacter sp.]
MNKQEFEQAVLADPNISAPEVQEAAQQSPERQKFLENAKLQNKEIADALKVTVPANLQSRLLNIATESQDNIVKLPEKKRPLTLWALAASVVFAVGLSFTFINPSHDNLNGSELAMAHFHHENPYSLLHNGDVPLEEVNAKLASFNTQMLEKMGQVTYANYCFFGRKKSVHMVMETVFGKVTFFVTSKDSDYPIDAQFGDEHYEGQSWSLQDVDITIIHERGKGNPEQYSELRRQIEYSA